MRSMIKRVAICGLLALSVWAGAVAADRETLNRELIRLHVVANSDSREDQDVKLRVRDAIVESLRQDLAQVSDVEGAKAYLQENLPKIQDIANRALQAAGCDAQAVVTLCKEAFDTRYYDTFTLPAGVYEALRVVIGEGEGHNWWCVVFPSLCLPATAEGFQAEAVGAGFSEELTDTLSGDYEVRFFLLDWLGKAESSLFSRK